MKASTLGAEPAFSEPFPAGFAMFPVPSAIHGNRWRRSPRRRHLGAL